MKTQKNIGIWMDHSIAHLIDSTGTKKQHSISSEFTNETKEEALSRSENLMHNKRQQMHEAYYKLIGKEVLKYDYVLLFGPTNAKVELKNYLKKDAHFNDTSIHVESAEEMTDNEKDAFVRKHFEAHN